MLVQKWNLFSSKYKHAHNRCLPQQHTASYHCFSGREALHSFEKSHGNIQISGFCNPHITIESLHAFKMSVIQLDQIQPWHDPQSPLNQ